jgi:hypothetical protein
VATDSNLVVHQGVALMICDSEAILEETLLAMDASKMHMKRIGDRAVVAPAYQLEQIREALQERGTYPKLIGDIVPPEAAEPDEEDEEDGEDAEGEEAEESEDDEESEDGDED